MKKNKFILMASGLVMLFGVTTLLISQRHPVDAENYNRNEVNAVAEPTPIGSSFSGIVIPKEDASEWASSARTKEQLAEEILAQYDWEGREDEKSMFHLVLLCTDHWLSEDGWEIQKEDGSESAFSAQAKEQFVEEFLAKYSWEGREDEKEMSRQVLLRADSLGAVYVLNLNDQE